MASVPVSFQAYNGSIVSANFLGSDQTFLLSSLGLLQSATLTDASGKIQVDETFLVGSNEYLLLGSGTVQPSLLIGLGSKVDVIFAQNTVTGTRFFIYPDGPPNILAAISMKVSIDPVGFDLSGSAPLCLHPDTPVPTASGERLAREITPGMRILDVDGRPAVVTFVLKSRHQADTVSSDKRLPIRIPRNAFGHGVPSEPIVLSPQHRVRPPVLETDNILVPAKSLLIEGLARQVRTSIISYVHVLCDRHVLFKTAGVAVETMFLGRIAKRQLVLLGQNPPQEVMSPAGTCVGASQGANMIRLRQTYQS